MRKKRYYNGPGGVFYCPMTNDILILDRLESFYPSCGENARFYSVDYMYYGYHICHKDHFLNDSVGTYYIRLGDL